MLNYAEQFTLCRKNQQAKQILEAYSRATLNIFQCRLLYWVSEAEQNITDPVRDLFYVLWMYFLRI
jgi:hypothetical protein